MKYLKLFENFQDENFQENEPNMITVKFNGDGFMRVYSIKFGQAAMYNLKNLQGEGHRNYGDGGLEMRKGCYYPIFKDEKNSIWYYIVYSGDEINIIQSSEHSDQGVDISNEFDSLKNITKNWYCKFDKGVKPGSIDHRGYFEIISIK